MNILEALNLAAETLAASGIEDARREASSLLSFVIKRDKTFLIAHGEYALNEAEKEAFREVLTRRARREPFQYIVGKQEFYGLDFLVTPDVLIPRPETEIIVEKSIQILKDKEQPQFCEVGTGSGCISIAILHEVEKACAVGLDISEKALKISAENAELHNVTERLKLKYSDVFSALGNEKFDLIVSNPPYIASGQIADLQPEVRDFEPLNALTDGKDGFSIIRGLILKSPQFLVSQGVLLIETGFDQSAEVESVFSPRVWSEIEYLYDLQGIARTVMAVLR